MPITKTNGVIVTTPAKELNTAEGLPTGVVRAVDFAVCDTNDLTKQLKFTLSAALTGATITFAAPTGATGDIVLTLPGSTGNLGEVVGPASSTDNAIARYDSTTGKLIQDSSVIVSDTGSMALGTASVLAPDSGAKLFQIGSRMVSQNVVGSQVWFGQNAYYNDGGWVRAEAGYGMGIRMHDSPGGVAGDGSIMFVTVPTGSAGAITEPTERMTIRNTGKVGIGVSDPSTALQVNGTVTATAMVPANGATGSFTSANGKTITVTNGIITAIV